MFIINMLIDVRNTITKCYISERKFLPDDISITEIMVSKFRAFDHEQQNFQFSILFLLPLILYIILHTYGRN